MTRLAVLSVCRRSSFGAHLSFSAQAASSAASRSRSVLQNDGVGRAPFDANERSDRQGCAGARLLDQDLLSALGCDTVDRLAAEIIGGLDPSGERCGVARAEAHALGPHRD